MELAPRLTRMMFDSFGRVAPSLTSQVAEKMLLTPRKFRAPEREERWLATGHAFSLEFEGRKLAAWSWGSSGRVVFLLHGWSGRAGQMTPFVGPLLDAGFSVVAFDGPAHGRSEGRTASVVQFGGALRQVVAWSGPAHAVIGHSMGGAAAALALTGGLRAKAAVLIAAPSGENNYSKEFAAHYGLSTRVQSLLQKRIERRFQLKFSDLKITAHARRQNTPLLVVHDHGDRDVPVREGELIAAAWPAARLVRTEGLGHVRILRDPGVIRQSVDFIKQES